MDEYLTVWLRKHDLRVIRVNRREFENTVLYIFDEKYDNFYFIPEYFEDGSEKIIIYCPYKIYDLYDKDSIKIKVSKKNIYEEKLVILKEKLPETYILNSFLQEYICKLSDNQQVLVTDKTEKIYLNDDEIILFNNLCNFLKNYQLDLPHKNILIVHYSNVKIFKQLFKILCSKLCINLEWDFKNSIFKINAKNYLIFKNEINFFCKSITENYLRTETEQYSFDKICGYIKTKKEINNIFFLFENYEKKLAELKIKMKRNILIYGPTGCGKTLFAKAIARKANCHIIEVKASSLISKWMGETERNIEQIFFEAQLNSPSIIIIDNFETFAYDSVYIHDIRMINTFLLEMDKVKYNDHIYIIGITQRKHDISQLFLSSGRFDEHIYIDYPDYESRLEIFKKYLLPVQYEEYEIMNFANITNEFSCADIIAAINKGKENALLKGGESCDVLVSDIINAINSLRQKLIF